MGEKTRELSEDYDVKEVLGLGGFSVVRRAVRKSSEGKFQVAIKTLKRFGSPEGTPQSMAEENSTASEKNTKWKHLSASDALLINEIIVMRKIMEDVSPHPNVIDLYDLYEDLNGVHLVLELCSGGELFDRVVDEEKYSEADAAAVVRQIANGLSALHWANIIHRDLKPENCLFLNKSEGSPLKIMDFGVSSIEEFTEPIVGLFGSIDYVSPEALSQGRVTSAADMWALGVILYILLSGDPPFLATSYRQKQNLILAGDISFEDHTWTSISPSAKQLISSLLTVDPQKRPTAQEILLHPWVIGHSAKKELMDSEIISRLHTFNARRKFRVAGIASLMSSTVMLRTKRLRNLLGSHDLTLEELDKLRMHFKTICMTQTGLDASPRKKWHPCSEHCQRTAFQQISQNLELWMKYLNEWMLTQMERSPSKSSKLP
ncbi:calcium/calmodulin-dependent serine/threonine-protein kinase-like isoform X2 [Telopea speciosissima]|uniref:calcium/calmodulin-dependent serine/threonine-protein kinase-like isoform X2 n=1 Tax=Telopea speciosissima TaxID=54955 RepID=UPI001CC3AE03|nr:calcium/calmodulin-dependent serine/threonine-protein kinase-like isoform X2 [Telopea speciosissima]